MRASGKRGRHPLVLDACQFRSNLLWKGYTVFMSQWEIIDADPFVWFRGLPLALWQRHLGERDTNESMANYVIGHYSLNLWHPLTLKMVDPNLFERSGANIHGQSCVHHGHTEFCWFCSIPSTTARRFPYHDWANWLVPNIVDGSKHDGGLR